MVRLPIKHASSPFSDDAVSNQQSALSFQLALWSPGPLVRGLRAVARNLVSGHDQFRALALNCAGCPTQASLGGFVENTVFTLRVWTALRSWRPFSRYKR